MLLIDVAELSTNLELIRMYEGRNLLPTTMDASENFLVIGYHGLARLGRFDVHDRRKVAKNGIHQRCNELVRKF